MLLESYSAEDTFEIGKTIGKQAQKGQLYCLVGDLGVGKTLFSKGFAKGLGIEEHITSPTFTIINEYDQLTFRFNHFDVYRINDLDEMNELGYEDYFYSEDITLVEWADLIEPIIPKEAIWINIEKDLNKGLDYRNIQVDLKVN